MRVHILFHHYDDDPTLMPNAVAVFDEYAMDAAGRDIWEEEMEKARETCGPGTYREAVVDLNENQVRGLFATPAVNTTSDVDPVDS